MSGKLEKVIAAHACNLSTGTAEVGEISELAVQTAKPKHLVSKSAGDPVPRTEGREDTLHPLQL